MADSTDDRVDPTGEFSGPPVDPEAGKAGMPGDPNEPPDSPIKAEAFADSPDEEMTKQLKKQYKDDVDQYQRRYDEQQRYYDYVQKSQAEMENLPQPQLQQMPPPSQDQKGQVTQRVLQVLAIAGIAFSLFGSRRNSGSRGALMGGIGSLIKGYLQGNEQRQKEDAAQWHQHNESIYQDNKYRMEGYNQIMANKKLRLADQMELFKMKGAFYHDAQMHRNAITGDLNKIDTHLKNMKKWQDAHAQNRVMSKSDSDEYRRLVLEKSQGKADTKTAEGSQWAMENYPPSQFYNEKKTSRKTDKETGKTSGGFTTGKESDTKKSEKPSDPLDLGLIESKKDDSEQPEASPTPTETPSVLGRGQQGTW